MLCWLFYLQIFWKILRSFRKFVNKIINKSLLVLNFFWIFFFFFLQSFHIKYKQIVFLPNLRLIFLLSSGENTKISLLDILGTRALSLCTNHVHISRPSKFNSMRPSFHSRHYIFFVYKMFCTKFDNSLTLITWTIYCWYENKNISDYLFLFLTVLRLCNEYIVLTLIWLLFRY